jgi:hypothetical protein
MTDDEHPDERDPAVASWLEVEPLDDAARRGLVTTAIARTGGDQATRRPTAWRWIAAAAAVVVLLAGGIAVLVARGGDDQQQASSGPRAGGSEALDRALSAAPDVGDFGDLGVSANLDALRAALEQRTPAASPPAAPAAAGAAAPTSEARCTRDVDGTIVAQGSGSIGGRAVTVMLVQGTDGARVLEALYRDSCEVRRLTG